MVTHVPVGIKAEFYGAGVVIIPTEQMRKLRVFSIKKLGAK